jgi:asparagine synthase (glutamine-hydrolysing)
MPGISLVYKKNSNHKTDSKKILDSLNHLSNYHSRVIVDQDNCFAGVNGYDSYPTTKMKIKGYEVIIEGKIYNRSISDIESQLDNLLSVSNSNYFIDRLSSWLLESDGDFVIYIINNESIFIFNDVFGRIPLYYFEDEDRLIVSRYLNFIIKSGCEGNMDSMAISLFLLLGYMLGDRTLLKNVKQLRAATLLIHTKGETEFIPLHCFNFDQKNNLSKNDKDIINDLRDLFSISCKDRFQNTKENIVTLSGGLDSRLVASAMNNNKIAFRAATMEYENGYASEEIGIAEKLCEIYKIKLDKIHVGPPRGSDLLELLKLKEGMNSLATSPIIPFYYKLINTYKKDFVYITGDNGDKIMFTLDRPPMKFNSIEDIVNFVINENSTIPVEIVSDITGITREEIYEEIKSIILNFPEHDYFQKYVHLRAIEKPFKFAFQGEDRHRSYFWNSSPFWSFGFFNYIMNCSDLSKRKHRIFAGLLNSYSREATNVTYSNFHSSINSFKGKMFMNLVYNIYPLISPQSKKMLKNKFFPGNPKVNENFLLFQFIKDQASSTEEISSYINTGNIENYGLNKVSAYNVFTITSAIEYLSANRINSQIFSENEFRL